jgi:zinc protease
MKVKRNRLRNFSIVCFLSIACFLFAARADAVNVHKTILPNGLILLHSENHHLPIVTVTLIIKSGQIHEPKEKAGLANLTAELLTEGTKSRTSRDISEATDFIGASLDASTGNDYTTVSLSVLKKDVRKGFELFSDVLLHPSFQEEELARKRDIIKGSLKHREEDPSFLAERAFREGIFGEYPYGRLIEGSFDTLDKIKREDLTQYYSEYFLPNNSILSVVGDLTSEELNTLVDHYLGAWKKGERSFVAMEKTNIQKNKKVIKIERDLTQSNVIIGTLGISRDNPDYYTVSVMNYILGGGGFSSRLMQSIREEKGLAYSVHSYFAAYKETGTFQAGVQTKNESASTAIDEILKQIERIRNEKVSDQELSDAKAYLTGSFPRRLDTNRKLADFLASVEFFNLGLDYDKRYTDYINAVTQDDVLRVARKYLTAENYVLVVVGDQKKARLKY